MEQTDNTQQNQAHLNFNNQVDRNLKHKLRNGNKKRFPPNKNDGFNKRWTDKNKDRKNSTNSAGIPTNFDSKNTGLCLPSPVPNLKLPLNLCSEINNSLTKISAISYMSTLNTYHPVGQSQREKFLRSSPIHAITTNPEMIYSERKMGPE